MDWWTFPQVLQYVLVDVVLGFAEWRGCVSYGVRWNQNSRMAAWYYNEPTRSFWICIQVKVESQRCSWKNCKYKPTWDVVCLSSMICNDRSTNCESPVSFHILHCIFDFSPQTLMTSLSFDNAHTGNERSSKYTIVVGLEYGQLCYTFCVTTQPRYATCEDAGRPERSWIEWVGWHHDCCHGDSLILQARPGEEGGCNNVLLIAESRIPCR